MRSDYHRHGFTPDDLPFVKRFEHIARTRWGWDDARIQDAYAWYRAAPVNQSREKLLADFYAHAERKGWPAHEADLAIAWHANVESDGIESFALPAPPSREDDARRRAEILDTLRTDGRKYFADEAMQNELYEINERLAGEAVDAATRPSANPNTPQQSDTPNLHGTGDSRRKSEIRDAMREGRAGAYWREGSTMPDEYRAILERESGQHQNPAPQSGSSDDGPSQASAPDASPST